jgi:formylglycine-generating enzyme required for sulfatase activity
MAKTFDDGSEEAIEQRLARLPLPGNAWSQYPPPEFPMPWASHWGQDAFGLWCGFSIDNQVQRLRWIPPGEFHMGSPEDEPERDDNERQHRVKLTRGFWLAETACPQALWQAVMGENPSRVQGEELPVAQVSWEEVKKFCSKLNERVSGLQARLPSEAEWEYTCRAGTETPFWWGYELVTELANYDGNYPYHNGPRGEFRQKTLPVKYFEPNPWGLYQMHGNVYEWCEDWHGEYPEAEVQVDPVGPERGFDRVYRGGSWAGGGRWLRAAYRSIWQPGVRLDDRGFRLAAGPRPGGAG